MEERNQKTLTLEEYKELAKAGDIDAMLECARKIAVEEKKPEESIEYLKMAIEKNSTEAMLVYARCLWGGGVGVKGNLEEAEKYFKLAAETETDESKKAYIKSDLATMLFRNGRKKEALKYYKEAIDVGYIRDMENFIELLYIGLDDDKISREEKLKYYKTASNLENSSADTKYQYAELLYDNGKGNEEELEEAEKYFKKAMDEGNPNAVYAYANLKGKSKQFVTDNLFKAYETYKETKETNFILQLRMLMAEKDIAKRKNIDFTLPVSGGKDNLIDLFVKNNLIDYLNEILVSGLTFEELLTVKEENRKKLMECLLETRQIKYFEKLFNHKDFLKSYSDQEKEELRIKLLEKDDISIDKIAEMEDKDALVLLDSMRKNVNFDSDMFNLLLKRVENKDEYLEKIDNVYLEGRNGYKQIKLTRKFNKSSGAVEIIDTGYARLKNKNNNEIIIGPKLYEIKYKSNGIEEVTFYDKDTGKPLVKMIIDNINKTKTYSFEGTEYENVENIKNEEEKMAIIQKFRDKIDNTIGNNFVNFDKFDCTLTRLEFASIALEDKINKKQNPTIFLQLADRKKWLKQLLKL